MSNLILTLVDVNGTIYGWIVPLDDNPFYVNDSPTVYTNEDLVMVDERIDSGEYIVKDTYHDDIGNTYMDYWIM